jgi:hypothetical protein
MHKKPTTVLQPGFPGARTEFMILEKMKSISIKGSKFNPKTIFWAPVWKLQCQWQKEFEFMLENF